MRLSSAQKILTELSRVYCDAVLIVTGGEPTLHPNFIEIINCASSLFQKVLINTNGSFEDNILNYLQLKLQGNVYAQISLDGTKTIHNKLRNTDLFDNVIDKLNQLQPYYKHIALATTVNPTNYGNIEELAELLNHYKFSHWKVSWEQVLNPSSDAFISYTEWNNLVDNILHIAKFRVYVGKLFDFDLWDKHIDNINPDTLLSNCGYGYAKFYVDSDFNVLPCSCTNDILGNLLTDSIEIIDNKLNTISQIIIPENSVCYNCRYKVICNSGCPGYSIKIFGIIGMGDIRCPMVSIKTKETC